MAINRTKQVKQMLQNGGMLVSPSKNGRRPGYRSAQAQEAQGRTGSVGETSSDSGFSGGNKEPSSTNREKGIMSRGLGPRGTTKSISNFKDMGTDRSAVSQFSTYGRNLMNQNLTKNNPSRKGLGNLLSRLNPLSFILGLINPALGFLSRGITSTPKVFNKFKSSNTLEEFRDKLRGYGKTMPVFSNNINFDQIVEDEKNNIENINLNDLEGIFKDQGLTVAPGSIIDEGLLEVPGSIIDQGLTVAPGSIIDKGLTVAPGSIIDQGLLEVPSIIDQGLLEVPSDFIDQGEIIALANGGRINAMNGGIMDLETGRQMYGLGKLVKKATRAIKKVVKSPLGKAALGLAAFKFGPAFLSGKGLGLGKAKTFSDLAFFGKNANVNLARLIGVPALLAGATTPKQEEEEIDLEEYYKQALIDPNAPLSRRILGTEFAANGGRIGYAEGSKEPVAKKIMPLLDMDGMEKDYRADGGFVPIGRMEKADDVPARLSKNEFVFTADAVRNAGGGNVDKGSEVMYNMMKNLEAGGEISEESQGLEGAREMFQTSQRLGEVI